MRIIGGQNRGLKLATPRGHEVRPILDRVRESLFGILREEVPESRVADLFSGTGVIGLEALSRGAAFCTFVERDPACIATIRENVRRARLDERSRIIHYDVFRSAEILAEPDGGTAVLAVSDHGLEARATRSQFDIIFVDPPYRLMRSPRNLEKLLMLIERLAEPDVLAAGGEIVLRFPSDVEVPARVGPLTQTDRRRWGGMKIAFLKRTEDAAVNSPRMNTDEH